MKTKTKATSKRLQLNDTDLEQLGREIARRRNKGQTEKACALERVRDAARVGMRTDTDLEMAKANAEGALGFQQLSPDGHDRPHRAMPVAVGRTRLMGRVRDAIYVDNIVWVNADEAASEVLEAQQVARAEVARAEAEADKAERVRRGLEATVEYVARRLKEALSALVTDEDDEADAEDSDEDSCPPSGEWDGEGHRWWITDLGSHDSPPTIVDGEGHRWVRMDADE